MRSVIVLEDGQRLVVEPSHTFRNVRVWIPGTGHLIAVPLEHAKTFALSVLEAAAAVAAVDDTTSANG